MPVWISCRWLAGRKSDGGRWAGNQRHLAQKVPKIQKNRRSWQAKSVRTGVGKPHKMARSERRELHAVLEIAVCVWAIACFYYYYEVHGFIGLIQALISAQ